MNYWVKVSIATGAIAGLVGLYFLDEHLSKKKEETEKVEARALNFESGKVRKIALTNENGTFVFERDNATTEWRMAEPAGKAKPDQEAVTGLVTALESLNSAMELSDTEKVAKGDATARKDFGLDKPRMSVELTLDDKSTKRLDVGADMDIGTKSGGKFEAVSAYALATGRNAVLVVNTSSISGLKKSFADLRTKSAGDFKTADVKSFVLVKKDGTTIRAVKGDKDWNLTSPRDLLADANNISVFLNTYSGFKVDKVTEKEMLAPEKLAAFGIDKPEATVQFLGADDKVLQEFKLGKVSEGNYITMADGAVGSFAADKWKDLDPELKFFRDRRVLRDVPLADVARIKTATGKTFVKENNAWYSAEASVAPAAAVKSTPDAKAAVASTPTPAGKTANTDVASLFSDWEFLTADDIIDGPEAKNLSAYGLDKPSAQFTLEFADGKKPSEVILVGNKVPKSEKMVYVKRASRDVVYAVESNWLDTLNRLDGKPAELKFDEKSGQK